MNREVQELDMRESSHVKWYCNTCVQPKVADAGSDWRKLT